MLPLAVGALMLGRGEIEKKGVQAPENVIEPDAFFAELAARDIKVYEGAKFENIVN